MQGKYDPRGNKKDIRPEHNKANYLDAVIETAVDWFKPYANHLIFIGYGNHETNILKRQETDMIQRFADLFNYTHKPDVPISVGGYGGWITLQFRVTPTTRKSYKIHYYHGSGRWCMGLPFGFNRDDKITLGIKGSDFFAGMNRNTNNNSRIGG